MATPSPYSRPAPIRCRCVANRTTQKAASFNKEDGIITRSAINIRTTSALSDGQVVYLSTANSGEPNFEEGATYFLKNITINNKYGRQNIYFGRSSCKFRAAPLALTAQDEKAAKEALCPPSQLVTGDEEDIFGRGDYLSLQGRVEKIQAVRMTEVHGNPVPILDLSLRCGQTVLDISLWRDEAVSELYLGDEVELTHLKAFICDGGKGKLNSSSYTSVKTAEREVVTEVIEVVGVCEDHKSLTLLCGNFEEFTIPATMFHGSVEDLIATLPTTVQIKHINKRVLNIGFTEKEQ